MINKENWKKEFDAGTTKECPICGRESEHVCRNCYSDISKETCWDNDGYCKKCFDFINNEIPKIDAEKIRLGVKCQCNDPKCAKCLGGNCQDDNCPVHSLVSKEVWRNK